MKWIKKGLVFFTDRQAGWMNSHAQCPTAIVLKDRIRIYFSARLPNQQSLPTFIDVEIDNPLRIMNINKIPILEMGRKGTFDENGIIPSYIVRKDNKVYLYYAGWSQCKNVPYKNFTGLAISSDEGETFEKYSEAPVFTMNEHNPLSATGPCIVQIENKYRALYSTGVDWVQVEDKLEHTYLLTDACSEDGVFWKTSGNIVVNPVFENEADCKPSVFKHGGLYHLWFSRRGSKNFRNPGDSAYRLGYAYSRDFISWTRQDENVGIDVSSSGWDSEMICYPHIIEVGDRYLMFYNGNGFGRSGFGYAELEL